MTDVLDGFVDKGANFCFLETADVNAVLGDVSREVDLFLRCRQAVHVEGGDASGFRGFIITV